MTDEQLAAEAARGDNAAFEALYTRYSTRLFNFSLRFLRNRGLAEDAAQQALLAAYRHIRGFRPDRGSFRAWLYTVCFHECCRMSSREELCVPAAENRVTGNSGEPGTTPDPSSILALEEALLRLPPHYRAAVLLTKLHGLTVSEAARVIGISETNARQRVFRGLNALRNILSPHC
jgi:RNA polymerase sigma factor (sigma-70 family)